MLPSLMEALPPDIAAQRVNAILDALDPRLVRHCRDTFEAQKRLPLPPLRPWKGRVVLVGHRASGKSRLLPRVAELLGLPGVDLDHELERQSGKSLLTWVREDEAGFRRAERTLFLSRPQQEVNAAGGGFLSLHADLLVAHTPVLIPVTFETYRERLLANRTRPRLRPELPLEEELRAVFDERERLHAKVGTLTLVDFLAAYMRDVAGGTP
jgi:shikimate kinase